MAELVVLCQTRSSVTFADGTYKERWSGKQMRNIEIANVLTNYCTCGRRVGDCRHLAAARELLGVERAA